MVRISLDVEGVLSNTHKAVCARSEQVTEEMMQEWGFPTEDDYKEFMHVSQNLWHNHHEEIPPMESGATFREVTSGLRDYGHTVDIVTHRHNLTGELADSFESEYGYSPVEVDEQVKAWLDYYTVEYDNFLAPSEEKDELDYDVYVDDKPALAERIANDPERVIALRDRPYNQDVDDSSIRVERINSLDELLFQLTDHYTVEAVRDLCAPPQKVK